MHYISCAPSIHETKGYVEFVAGHPCSTHTENVGVFRKRHELCFPLQEFEGLLGQAIKVEDLESHGDWSAGIWRLVGGGVDNRRSPEPNSPADGVIFSVVAVVNARSTVGAMASGRWERECEPEELPFVLNRPDEFVRYSFCGHLSVAVRLDTRKQVRSVGTLSLGFMQPASGAPLPATRWMYSITLFLVTRPIIRNVIYSHDPLSSLLLPRPPFVPPPISWHPRMPVQNTNT